MARELTAKEITEIVDSGILDDEIIRAFQICSSEHLGCEDNCPFNERCSKDPNALDNAVLDLINRQKAEIERLQHREEILEAIIKTFELSHKRVKSEAIKEFAERLKTKTFLAKEKGSVEHILWIDEIDNLVKEMVGE